MSSADRIKPLALSYLKKWWVSLLLLPFIYYTLHQTYWALRFNIFFAISYNFPFPVNIIHFLLDNIVLLTHEAGHTFLGIFGIRFITVLGGSLFQISVPLMILYYSWSRKSAKAIQCSFYYLGFSWLQMSMYAADGGQQQLPLIGGLSSEYHDWLYLLSYFNILDKDQLVGILIAFLGGICYILSLTVPIFIKNYEEAKLNINF